MCPVLLVTADMLESAQQPMPWSPTHRTCCLIEGKSEDILDSKEGLPRQQDCRTTTGSPSLGHISRKWVFNTG